MRPHEALASADGCCRSSNGMPETPVRPRCGWKPIARSSKRSRSIDVPAMSRRRRSTRNRTPTTGSKSVWSDEQASRATSLQGRDAAPQAGERTLRLAHDAQAARGDLDVLLGAPAAFRGRLAEPRGDQPLALEAFERGVDAAE